VAADKERLPALLDEAERLGEKLGHALGPRPLPPAAGRGAQ
jgi:hypothetical protein